MSSAKLLESTRRSQTDPLLADANSRRATSEDSMAARDDSIYSRVTADTDIEETHAGFGAFNEMAKRTFRRPLSYMAPRTKRTWDGVFLPVSISVFGVVLFIRLPWIVGECGLWLTLVNIGICYLVSGLTTISLAAISTNGYTGDGGPYMMISRCLGPQIGLNVGGVFVASNIIASAMYLTGGSDVMIKEAEIGPLLDAYNANQYWVMVGVSSLILFVLLVIALLKIEKFFRMFCLLLTIIALVDVVVYISITDTPHPEVGFTAFKYSTLKANWGPSFSEGVDFPKTLSILFPGCTGLMSGVCLSGEIKNGAKAIPRGIGFAWIVSLLIYVLVAILVAGAFEREKLQMQFRALEYASHPYIFVPGELTATVAAVLSMLIGSSRVVKAMAKDRLIDSRVARLISKMTLRQSVVMIWGIIQLAILLGNHYEAASLFATLGFLANFLALNLSTFVSAATSLPSFRPVYRFFNKFTALFGAFTCVIVMFVISALWAAIIIAAMITLLILADWMIRSEGVSWGDASQPLLFYIVRKWLLRLDERKEHIRHWRPSILHLVTDPLCSLNLIHLANNLKKGGLYEIAMLVEGDFVETSGPCNRWKAWLMDFIAASGVKAFAVVSFGKKLRTGMRYLLRNTGLGGMRPNSVLLSLDELLMEDAFDEFYNKYQSEFGTQRLSHASDFYPSMAELGMNDYEAESASSDDAPHQPKDLLAAAPRAALPNTRGNRRGDAFAVRMGGRGHSTSEDDSSSEDDADDFGEEEAFKHVSTSLSSSKGVGPRSENLSSGNGGKSSRNVTATVAEGAAVVEIGGDNFVGGSSPADQNDTPAASMHHNNTSGNSQNLPTVNQKSPTTDAEPSQPSQHIVSEKPTSPNEAKEFQNVLTSKKSSAPATSAASPKHVEIFPREPSSRESVPRSTEEDISHCSNIELDSGTNMGAPAAIASYRSYRRSMTWKNFFVSNKTGNEKAELDQLQKMVEFRSFSRVQGNPGLLGFRSFKTFVNIVRDVYRLGLTAIVSRNMEKLDKERIKRNKEPLFIDLWMPEEDDAIMFMMAHSLHRTSVWTKHTRIRVIWKVVRREDRLDATEHLQQVLKDHRIDADAVVVSLEEQLPRMWPTVVAELNSAGIRLPDEVTATAAARLEWLETFMDMKHGKVMINNALMRNAELGDSSFGTMRTALSMIRVDPPPREPRRRQQRHHSKRMAFDPAATGADLRKSIEGSLHWRRHVEQARRPSRDTHVADEEGIEWVEDLAKLSDNMPPVLMVLGGAVKCRDNDW